LLPIISINSSKFIILSSSAASWMILEHVSIASILLLTPDYALYAVFLYSCALAAIYFKRGRIVISDFVLLMLALLTFVTFQSLIHPSHF
jgi:uncharacterized membrane protein YkgB